MKKIYKRFFYIIIIISVFLTSCNNEDISTENQNELFYKAFAVNSSPSPIKNKGVDANIIFKNRCLSKVRFWV